MTQQLNTSSKTQIKIPTVKKKGHYTAAVIAAPGKISYEQVGFPEIKPTQLLVKMEGCGLCASNIPVWEGREWFNYPLPAGQPGHEGWGVVEDIGALVTKFKKGERITMLHGSSFSEYAVVDQEDAIKLPSELDGIPFPGEALGCLMNILERADIIEGQTVAVIGMGFIGLGLVQLLSHKGVRVIAVSRREESLSLAAVKADYCLKSDDYYQVTKSILDITNGKGCERVIECTGHQFPLDIATEIIAEYGKLIIAGYHQDGLRQINLQKWNWKAIDVINAHERDSARYLQGIETAVEVSRVGLLNPKALISHAYPFEKLDEGLRNLTESPEGLVKSYVFFS